MKNHPNYMGSVVAFATEKLHP